jgi:alpha-mannosidase
MALRHPLPVIGMLCSLLLLGPSPLPGQTAVDLTSAALDSVGSASINNWRMSPDIAQLRGLTGDPTKPGFDDSKWETLRLNQRVYPDSCWLRKEIVVPTTIFGQPVTGKIRFVVSLDDYGYLWVNGTSRGYFPWDGEFDITADARPGQKLLLVMKAVNTGGPMRLMRAEFAVESVDATADLIRNLSLSFRVAQKLLSFDTYQTSSNRKYDYGTDNSTIDKGERTKLNTLLQSLATRIDVGALGKGDLKTFTSSVDAVRAELKPIKDFAKKFTLYFDANAHIDAAWLWRSKETIAVCKNTFSSVINMMQQRPDFTYTQSSAAYYDWMQRLYPDLFAQMKDRIKDGRWEVIGGMWVEPDCNIPSGESWARHLLYAQRYFKKNLGTTATIGWNPDSFGYTLNMPEFYANAGIDAFITQKIGWNETNVFPHRLFWWQSPDGSRILSYFPFDYVNTVENAFQLVDWLRQYEANTGFRKLMILFGVGDHGGGPSLEMLQRIDRLAALDIFPTIEHGTAGKYLSWLRGQDLSRLPVWTDELYLEYHQGTFTTQAAMKRYNRSNETLLTTAERFSSLSTLYGGSYNATDLESAWHMLLFNQFHDILPGSGIREVYIDAAAEHQQVGAIGTFELQKAVATIASHVNTTRGTKGTPIVVFNPLSWERRDLIRLELPQGDTGAYAVFNANGTEIPSQTVTVSKYVRQMLFVADHVPGLGYATFDLRKQKPTALHSPLKSGRWSLENDLFRVTVDSASGWVRSIVDKTSGKEIVNGFGNQLQLLEDLPKAWDAWNLGWTGTVFPSTFRGGTIVETGPVRVVLRLTRDYLKPGTRKDFPTEDFPSTFFTQDIVLYNGLDRIDFTTDVDWWEDKTMLKVAFPLAVTDTMATYEIPFGTIRRSTQMRNSWDSAKVEVPASRWADVSGADFGVTLLNDAKYGYDIKGNTMRLSLLRSPKWPDPTADRGKHSINYALYPHAGTWQQASTLHRGYEYNYPLVAVTDKRHGGTLPAAKSFVQLGPSNLVLTTIKKAEDSRAWIVQWYETNGEAATATLQLPFTPKRVRRSNFLETDGETLPVEGSTVRVPTKANGVMTVKVEF